MNSELERRLLFILHRGLVEARLLAQAKNHAQLFDLADALEPIPSYMASWDDRHLESIRFSLRNYQNKYPSPSFNYPQHLDSDSSPPSF